MIKSILAKFERMMDRPAPDDDIQFWLEKEPFLKEYKAKIGIIFAAVCVLAFSLLVFYVSAKTIRAPQVQLVTKDGDRVSYLPGFGPNTSAVTIQRWALEAVQKIYTFDFYHMDEQLGGADEYFTPAAWSKFKDMVATAELYKSVRKNKLMVEVVPVETPTIQMVRRSESGLIEWTVLIPVMLNFKGDISTESQSWTMQVVIQSMATTDHPKGLGIKSLSPIRAQQQN